MLPSEYEVELLAKEIVRERLREAERDRLVRAARGAATSPRWRRAVTWGLGGLGTMLAALRAGAPRRRVPSGEPSLGCERCRQGVCEA
jgi:hypothetical protein